MKRLGKSIRKLLVFGFLLLVATACGRQEEVEGSLTAEVYYLNKEETKISKETHALMAADVNGQIQELLQLLSEAPENVENKAVISSTYSVLGAVLDGEQLMLTVDEAYKDLEPGAEILTRAALVRTLTQVPGVEYVSMKVREEALLDKSGNPVGIMTADMFVDNAGDEINAYEKVKLRLYFADESGTRLIGANRTVVYNSNISMEKLVVEQLIKGPSADGLYPVINPETKIVTVTVKDGTCYVNLNESFLTQVYNVTSEVTIYALTNSLVELPNVNKVQISINGDTSGTYRESLPFSTIFERNLELMESGT